MAIKISGTTIIDNDTNVNAGIGTFTELDVPITPVTFNPSDGATDVDYTTNIVITFNQLIGKGSGNITLRDGSASGTIIQTIGVTSTSVTTSGAQAIIEPVGNLPISTDVYVVVDAGAFIGFVPNEIINTYNFTVESIQLGEAYEGGYLICESSGVRWVVSPIASEVTRDWYSREHANIRAQQVSGCTGWFVPTVTQLQNPGWICRTYWDQDSTPRYWSNTQNNSSNACSVYWAGGNQQGNGKTDNNCVRAFRCVTY